MSVTTTAEIDGNAGCCILEIHGIHYKRLAGYGLADECVVTGSVVEIGIIDIAAPNLRMKTGQGVVALGRQSIKLLTGFLAKERRDNSAKGGIEIDRGTDLCGVI